MVFTSSEALVEQELETVVVRLDEKTSVPQVRSLVPHHEHKTHELPLICRQGAMPGRNGPAEEGDRVGLLKQHGAKAVCGRVAFHDEGLGEVGQR